MKVAILFSGGKDSTLSAILASEKHEISCLISLVPENNESYMFQKSAEEILRLEALAMELPIIIQNTKGNKEEELLDLRAVISKAKKLYEIEGLVSGAIESVYQASRIQKICLEEDIFCFNPLWQIRPENFLKLLFEKKVRARIVSVCAYPLEARHIGLELDWKVAEEFKELNKKFGLHICGEGGEFETLVLDSPLHKKKIRIDRSEIRGSSNSYEEIILEAKLE